MEVEIPTPPTDPDPSMLQVGGGTNPFEKYARQILFIFPKFSGWKQNIFETTT